MNKLQRMLVDSRLTVEFCNDGTIILYHNGQDVLLMHQDSIEKIIMFVAGWNLADLRRK